MVTSPSDLGASARTRIAWRLLPFLFLLYVANYLDRTNIALRQRCEMKSDLGLSDSIFGTASGIFFIGYFALQIPGRSSSGTLERASSARVNIDHLGRTHDAYRFRAHSAGALRRAFSPRRGGGRFLSRRHCLSFALVFARTGESDGAVHVGDSDRLHRWRAYRWSNSRVQLVRNYGMAMAFPAGRNACYRSSGS